MFRQPAPTRVSLLRSVTAALAGVTRSEMALAAAATCCVLLDSLLNAGRSHPLEAIVLSLAVGAPLLLVRRWPLAVLVVTIAAAVGCAAALDAANGAIAAALVPLFETAAVGWRRRSIVIGAVTMATLIVATAILSSHLDLTAAALRLLVLLGAIAAGDIVRSRRALHLEEARRREEQALRHARDQERRLAEERLRIARDVHDSVGHALVAINVQAGVAAHLGAESPAAHALLDIKRLSADALNELRATLGVVRTGGDDAPTSPRPDLASLSQLVESTRRSGLEVRTDISDAVADAAPPVSEAAFRIVQESLTNALRHASATLVAVTLDRRDDVLEVTVDDDGTAALATPQPIPAGHGLAGMRERATALGGQLDAGPRDTGGWRVRALLPLRPGPT